MKKIHTSLFQLLPGMLPLIIYIAADTFFGTRTGLIITLLVGAIELALYYFATRKFDLFIIADLLLVSLLAGISILLENPVFFRMKPALMESVILLIFGFSAFSPVNLLELMSKRYMKGMDLSPHARQTFRVLCRILFVLFALHLPALVYVSLYGSKSVWFVMSTVVPYLLFIPAMLYLLFRNRVISLYYKIKYKDAEWFPLINSEGKQIGKAPRQICHNGSCLLHAVVHLHVFDSNGRLFLQKRSMKKEIQPGRWDTSVGGHIALDESVEDALKRESREEIGITEFSPSFLYTYFWRCPEEHELVYAFMTVFDGKLCVDKDEVDEGAFFTKEEIEDKLGSNFFTPNFECEFALLKNKDIFETIESTSS